MSSGPIIFLTAAEASGDHHAAELIRALKVRIPGARFVGAAGPAMAAEGCEVVLDMTQKASMILGPVANLSYYRRCVKTLSQAMAEIKPDIHVPVDSPALNWHLAKSAKKLGVPVMYYVAPQVWAWAPWRIKKVRRLTDHVACLLPFEEEYFNTRGVKATYVGHPLFDQLPPQRLAEDCPDLTQAWLDGKWRVALLPGSRPGEIKKHTGPLIRLAASIKKRWPEAVCTITAVNQSAADRVIAAAGWEELAHAERPCDIVVGRTAEVLADSHFAVACSGTVTLEVAHFGVPMLVLFRASKLAYNLVGRWLLRIRNLSLVNILAGREIVPELMPWFGDEDELTTAVLDVMGDIGWLTSTRQKLLGLTGPLAMSREGGASANVADIIAGMVEQRQQVQGNRVWGRQNLLSPKGKPSSEV